MPARAALSGRSQIESRGIGWQPLLIGLALCGGLLLIDETAFGAPAIAH